MSATIPVPRDTVEEILGYGTVDEPRVLGACTSETAPPGETVDLTLPQVGALFQWAWADADGWFDTDDLVAGADPVAAALDCRTSDADRLRNLILWAAGHVDPIFTVGESTVFDAHKDGADCVVLRVKDGLKLRYATLERIAGSRVLGTQATWVLRRLDWLLPQEGRDPDSVPAVTEAEMRAVVDVLTRLNGEVRRGVGG
jgi:hypothetical protein